MQWSCTHLVQHPLSSGRLIAQGCLLWTELLHYINTQGRLITRYARTLLDARRIPPILGVKFLEHIHVFVASLLSPHALLYGKQYKELHFHWFSLRTPGHVGYVHTTDEMGPLKNHSRGDMQAEVCQISCRDSFLDNLHIEAWSPQTIMYLTSQRSRILHSVLPLCGMGVYLIKQ